MMVTFATNNKHVLGCESAGVVAVQKFRHSPGLMEKHARFLCNAHL